MLTHRRVGGCEDWAGSQFAVDDVQAEYERLSGLGVRLTQEPLEMGPVSTAVFDDTCGNLIQIATQPK